MDFRVKEKQSAAKAADFFIALSSYLFYSK
jgi:hypothetical protein